jgi:adenylyltransferase/sulfurtransferase
MDERAARYDRQIRVPQIGAEGQRRLRQATAAVVGLGALGSIGADLLTRAGIGRLILIDRDVVDWSNLQRQSLYSEEDAALARPKAEAALARLRAVNSDVRLDAHPADLTAENAQRLLADADLVLDGTDNFATRWLLNDWAVLHGRSYVYAGVVATYGMVGAIVPGGPCLRCTWPEPPSVEGEPTCRSAGVLGPAVAVIGGLAAGEALKIVAGRAGETFGGFLHVDLWTGDYQRVHSARDPACPCCTAREFPWLDGLRGTRAAEPVCGGNAVQVPLDARALDLAAIAQKLGGTVAALQVHERFLRWNARGLEVFLFADGRALVRGTEDPARARAAVTESLGG